MGCGPGVNGIYSSIGKGGLGLEQFYWKGWAGPGLIKVSSIYEAQGSIYEVHLYMAYGHICTLGWSFTFLEQVTL